MESINRRIAVHSGAAALLGHIRHVLPRLAPLLLAVLLAACNNGGGGGGTGY